MGLKDFQLCNIEVLQSRSVSQLCVHAIISIHVGCAIMFQLYIYVNYRYSLPNLVSFSEKTDVPPPLMLKIMTDLASLLP